MANEHSVSYINSLFTKLSFLYSV